MKHVEAKDTKMIILKTWLRYLIIIAGILVGAAAGFGIALLILLLAEVIIQPKYPDLLMGWFYWPLVVCVPLIVVVFGVLFNRLSGRLLQTRSKHPYNKDKQNEYN